LIFFLSESCRVGGYYPGLLTFIFIYNI